MFIFIIKRNNFITHNQLEDRTANALMYPYIRSRLCNYRQLFLITVLIRTSNTFVFGIIRCQSSPHQDKTGYNLVYIMFIRPIIYTNPLINPRTCLNYDLIDVCAYVCNLNTLYRTRLQLQQVRLILRYTYVRLRLYLQILAMLYVVTSRILRNGQNGIRK